MKWLNKFDLPLPLAEAIMEDLYYGKREESLQAYIKAKGLDPATVVHFSVNELIKSPRQVILARRYRDSIVKDVAAEVFRILGTAIHLLLWMSARRANERQAELPGLENKPYYTAEERMFAHFIVDGQVVVISGEPDLVHGNVIDDYKVTAVWSWLKGIKEEWEKQLNGYAFFRTLAGKLTEGLRICFILRDWNVNETVQAGYPPAGAMMEPVKLWSFEQQQAFIMDRIKLHLSHQQTPDDELPDCSSKEMWEKPDAYAVIREGGKRAAKVFSSSIYIENGADQEAASLAARIEAETDCVTRNGAPAIQKGKEKGYSVEHRPGERTRCLRFCDAAPFCTQFQEYQAAAFRGEPTEAA